LTLERETMGICASRKDTTPITGTLNTNMVHERHGDVFKKYEVVHTIGEGSIGAISKARIRDKMKGGSAYHPEPQNLIQQWIPHKDHKGTLPKSQQRSVDVYYALKTIQLSRITPEYIDELRNEICILKSLDHPNIVKAYEVFEKKSQIYIVMELCSGGDLYKRLPYSERDAAKISGKLISAIKYMHDNNIVHRDLKFENIMFENNSPDAEIKVIDFGLSTKFLPEDRFMTEGVGTIYTMAPQVLQGVYTSQADLWSCGVISFMLLSSQKPFYHKLRRRAIDKIMRAEYSFDTFAWDLISNEAKDFVSKLLLLDPMKRMTATEALKHHWLHQKFILNDKKPPDDIMDDVKENLLAYKYTSDLKKVALNVIAHKSTTDEIFQLRNAFDEYDKSKDGIITFDEFKAGLKSCNISDDDMEDIFESIDVNQTGYIVYTEFLAATLEVKGRIEEERIAEAFERIDSDDNGFISKENLARLLGKDCTPERVDRLIKEADADKDGQISFQEFLNHFRKDTTMLARSTQNLNANERWDNDKQLLGLDAIIPGGKYDSERSGIQ